MNGDAWSDNVSRPISLFAEGAWSKPAHSDVSTWGLARRLLNPPAPTIRAWSCPVCDTSRSPRRWAPGPCSTCGTDLVPCKRALPAWSPWTFRGERRSATTADRCGYLVVEYDGVGGSCDDIRARWAAWAHLGHTTWSHREAGAARARVVVPLERAITAAEWPAVWAHAREVGAELDTQCSDPGRLWFLSLAIPGFEAWKHDGSAMPVPAEIRRMESLPPLPPATNEAIATLSAGRLAPGVIPWLKAYREATLAPLADACRELGRRLQARKALGGDRPGGGSRGAGQVDASRLAGGRRYPISDRWRSDATARRALGVTLGGVVEGKGSRERVRRVTCPGCGQASVWWEVAPATDRQAAARCDHRHSCGWWSWLDQLARGVA